MEEFENNFSAWVLRYRFWIMPSLLVIIAACALGTKNLKFTSDYQIFFAEDNPELLAFEAMEQTFAEHNNVLVAIEPQNGEVFTRETLALVEEFTERAWQVPFSFKKQPTLPGSQFKVKEL